MLQLAGSNQLEYVIVIGVLSYLNLVGFRENVLW
jgi:hypothetical protein